MVQKGDNSCGISGAILGILGIVLSGVYGIILGITGIVFSVRQKNSSPNSWSKAGIILNIISIVLGIITLIASIYLFAKSPELLQQLNSFSAGQ